MSLKQQYHDNLLLQSDNLTSSVATVASPEINYLIQRSSLSFSSSLAAESARYWQSPDDNYNNVAADALLDWQMSTRNRLKFSSGYTRKNEKRGTAFSAGRASALQRPDIYKDTTVEGLYRYGAESARGRLEFAAGRRSRKYSTRREITKERDRDIDYGSTAFFLGLGGRTAALLQFEANSTNYRSNEEAISNSARFIDSNGRVYFMGFTWQATGKTEGDIRLGYAEKEFDDPQAENFSGVSWQAAAKWSPRSYSSFKVKTGRRPIETDGSGIFIDEQTWHIAWQHRWQQGVRVDIATSIADRDYQGSLDNRNETIRKLSASWSYKVKRWLGLGFTLARERKHSNIAIFEYTGNLAELNLELSI